MVAGGVITFFVVVAGGVITFFVVVAGGVIFALLAFLPSSVPTPPPLTGLGLVVVLLFVEGVIFALGELAFLPSSVPTPPPFTVFVLALFSFSFLFTAAFCIS